MREIYLTELAYLSEGLYWARRKPAQGNPYGPWMMIGLIGHSPFLTFYIVVSYDKGKHEWKSHPNYGGDGITVNNPLNPNEWEFGPRIEPPVPGQRVEYAPRVASVQP